MAQKYLCGHTYTLRSNFGFILGQEMLVHGDMCPIGVFDHCLDSIQDNIFRCGG